MPRCPRWPACASNCHLDSSAVETAQSTEICGQPGLSALYNVCEGRPFWRLEARFAQYSCESNRATKVIFCLPRPIARRYQGTDPRGIVVKKCRKTCPLTSSSPLPTLPLAEGSVFFLTTEKKHRSEKDPFRLLFHICLSRFLHRARRLEVAVVMGEAGGEARFFKGQLSRKEIEDAEIRFAKIEAELLRGSGTGLSGMVENGVVPCPGTRPFEDHPRERQSETRSSGRFGGSP